MTSRLAVGRRGVSHRLPPGRIQALARFAATAKASAIQRLPEERRLATLVAFALTLEATALDDVLDLLDILTTEVFSDATKAGKKSRRGVSSAGTIPVEQGRVTS